MPYVNLFLSDELHERLKTHAKAAGQPMYRFIPELLESQVPIEVTPIKQPEGADLAQKAVELRTSKEEVDFGIGLPRPAPKPVRGRRVRS